MNLPESSTRVQSIDTETLLAHTHRAKDLLTGARAWLSGITVLGAGSASNAVLEARAELDNVIRALESLSAVEAEAKRAEHLHRDEAARATRILDEAQRLDRAEAEAKRNVHAQALKHVGPVGGGR